MASRSSPAPADIPPGADAVESERELRALVRISAAVAGAMRFEDVLEVAAEEALAVLGAASASISRWDRGAELLRTLVNVGELAPDEANWPVDETYPLAQFPRATALLERGRPHTTNLGDTDADPEELRLLGTLGKRASVAVPIVHAGTTWGELYATIALDSPRRLGPRELRFGGAVADQIAVAVVRAESFSRITRLAFEDPLTGLANRRAFEDRLGDTVDRAQARGTDVALVLCDLDALKMTNDEHGHAAGDARLIATARVLAQVAAPLPDAMAARIGGDEFALLLPDAAPADAERAADAIGAALLTAEPAGSTVSVGVAALSLGPRRPSELVRLADAAQYRSKRTGHGRVSTAIAGHEAPEPAGTGRRRNRARHALDVERLIRETAEGLDGPLAQASALSRIDAVTQACTVAVGGAAWAVSRTRADDVLETLLSGDAGRPGEQPPQSFQVRGDSYRLEDFPATARLLRDAGSLFVRVDDPGADPAERAFLGERGLTQMLAIGIEAAAGPTLVELYAARRDAPLEEITPFLRVLLSHAVR